MNYTETEARQRVEDLTAGLNRAYQAMISASSEMSAARALFTMYKGFLNEQQFTQRLEAVSGDPVKARELLQQQDDKRLAFESARLALRLSLTQLAKQRDQFARSAMEVKAWVPHIKYQSLKRRLAGSCVQYLLDAHAFNEEVMQSFAREPDSLSSGPRGHDNIIRAFDEWRRQDWKTVKFDTTDKSGQNVVQRSYSTGVHGQEVAGQNSTLALIPLHFGGDRARQYRILTENMVFNAELAIRCTSNAKQGQMPADFAAAQRSLSNLKGTLNEAQYTLRLSDAIARGDSANVKQLKEMQQQKRLHLSSARATIAHYMTESLIHASEAAHLARSLADALEFDMAAGIYLEPDLIVSVKNNALAGHRVALFTFEHAASVTSDLKSTEFVEELAGNALLETLNSLTDKPPYRSLQWTVYQDGSVVEPL